MENKRGFVPRHKYDTTGECQRYGANAETWFCKAADKYGWKLTPASANQNMREHWDYLMTNGEEEYRVEVKGLKKIKRSDEGIQDEKVWIELHGGGSEDNKGWLYGAKSDLIAFEMLKEFYIVDRAALKGVVAALVNFEDKTNHARTALYRVYSRRPPDLVTLLMKTDLEPAIWQKWNKLDT